MQYKWVDITKDGKKNGMSSLIHEVVAGAKNIACYEQDLEKRKIELKKCIQNIQFLVKAGGNVDALNVNGATPLVSVCNNKNAIYMLPFIEGLLELKADPNKQDKDKKSSMFYVTHPCHNHNTAIHGRYMLVSLLMLYGGKPYNRTYEPIHYYTFEESNQDYLYRLIERFGAEKTKYLLVTDFFSDKKIQKKSILFLESLTTLCFFKQLNEKMKLNHTEINKPIFNKHLQKKIVEEAFGQYSTLELSTLISELSDIDSIFSEWCKKQLLEQPEIQNIQKQFCIIN